MDAAGRQGRRNKVAKQKLGVMGPQSSEMEYFSLSEVAHEAVYEEERGAGKGKRRRGIKVGKKGRKARREPGRSRECFRGPVSL